MVILRLLWSELPVQMGLADPAIARFERPGQNCEMCRPKRTRPSKPRTMPDRVSIGLQNYLLTPAALHFKVIVLFQIGNNLIQRRNYMEFIAAELVSTRDLNFGR